MVATFPSCSSILKIGVFPVVSNCSLTWCQRVLWCGWRAREWANIYNYRSSTASHTNNTHKCQHWSVPCLPTRPASRKFFFLGCPLSDHTRSHNSLSHAFTGTWENVRLRIDNCLSHKTKPTSFNNDQSLAPQDGQHSVGTSFIGSSLSDRTKLKS
jgi:hypothetical protein